MRDKLFRKGLVVGIIVLLIATAVLPVTMAMEELTDGKKKDIPRVSEECSIEYGYITRNKIMEIAEGYKTHEWYPTTDNIFHGNYMGVRVDTPDKNTYPDRPPECWKPGELNIGVPFQLYGFSSISGFNLTNPEDFDEQYTGTGEFDGIIHFAGDIFAKKIRECPRACGVDCAGFVSRCWNLPTHHYSFIISNIRVSHPIKFDELKKGDILNIPSFHVMLFIEFADEEKKFIRIIQASSKGKVNETVFYVSDVSEDGFHVTIENDTSYVWALYRYNCITGHPNAPTITGKRLGKPGVEYEYTFTTTDPDGDDIIYGIDWNDGTDVEWVGPHPSGEKVTVTHTWNGHGKYIVRAKAKDTNGSESGWTALSVSMPRNRVYVNTPFLNFLHQYLNLFPILRLLLQRLGLQ